MLISILSIPSCPLQWSLLLPLYAILFSTSLPSVLGPDSPPASLLRAQHTQLFANGHQATSIMTFP